MSPAVVQSQILDQLRQARGFDFTGTSLFRDEEVRNHFSSDLLPELINDRTNGELQSTNEELQTMTKSSGTARRT